MRLVADQRDGPRPATRPRDRESDVKLQKLAEKDDMEAYLTTFERVMQAYEVAPERWAYKLAPKSTGRAQQAYAAMPAEEAGDYEALKIAILRRYDICEETYRQRFRGAERKEDETYRELAVRVMDLLTKWMKDKMDSVHTILEQMAIEQLMLRYLATCTYRFEKRSQRLFCKQANSPTSMS